MFPDFVKENQAVLCVGITTMCLVQINRIHQFDNGKEQVKDEKDCKKTILVFP